MHSLTLALDDGEWSSIRPGFFSPGGKASWTTCV